MYVPSLRNVYALAGLLFWCFTRCTASQEINMNIILSGAYKQFATPPYNNTLCIFYRKRDLLAICAGIHRWPVNSPHNGQWRGALVFSLICFWINVSVNNREACDLRRHRTHYDVTVMRNTLSWLMWLMMGTVFLISGEYGLQRQREISWSLVQLCHPCHETNHSLTR